MKKSIMAMVLCFVCLSSGCLPASVSTKFGCLVYSVDGMSGCHNIVCGNQSDLYYLSDNKIWQYKGKEEPRILVQTEYGVEYMACNQDYLYYTDNRTGVYRVDVENGESQKLFEEEFILGITSHEEDVFVLVGPSMWRMEEAAIYFFHGTEEGIRINDAFVDLTVERGECQVERFQEYEICFYGGKDGTFIAWMKSKDESWNYAAETDVVYTEIGGKLLQIGDKEYYFDGKKHGLQEVLEAEDFGGCTSNSHIMVQDDAVYMLFQYGDAYQAYGENPRVGYLEKTAVFCLRPEEQKCELLYESTGKERIAGFSVENDVVYLLKEDGVYTCSMTGKNERKLYGLEKPEEHKDLAFEYYDGRLFVFEAWGRLEFSLITILELNVSDDYEVTQK